MNQNFILPSPIAINHSLLSLPASKSPPLPPPTAFSHGKKVKHNQPHQRGSSHKDQKMARLGSPNMGHFHEFGISRTKHKNGQDQNLIKNLQRQRSPSASKFYKIEQLPINPHVIPRQDTVLFSVSPQCAKWNSSRPGSPPVNFIQPVHLQSNSAGLNSHLQNSVSKNNQRLSPHQKPMLEGKLQNQSDSKYEFDWHKHFSNPIYTMQASKSTHLRHNREHELRISNQSNEIQSPINHIKSSTENKEEIRPRKENKHNEHHNKDNDKRSGDSIGDEQRHVDEIQINPDQRNGVIAKLSNGSQSIINQKGHIDQVQASHPELQLSDCSDVYQDPNTNILKCNRSQEEAVSPQILEFPKQTPLTSFLKQIQLDSPGQMIEEMQEDDELTKAHLTIKQQTILIKKLRNQIRLMRLRENQLLTVVAKLRKYHKPNN